MFKKILKKIGSRISKFVLQKCFSIEKNLFVSKEAKVDIDILASCGEGTKFMGDVGCFGNIEIGRFTSINGPGTVLAAKLHKIKIGSFCSIAPSVLIQEHFHRYDRITTYYINKHLFKGMEQDDIFSKGDIVIEDDVWIGAQACILSGVRIGRGSIIGAGSVVTRDVPSYTIVGGNPAKEIKKRFRPETINILEQLEWWSWDRKTMEKNKEIFAYSEEGILKNKDKILSLV